MRALFPTLVLACVALACDSLSSRVPSLTARPPNLVLILVDDLGWRDLGISGNGFHETPRIDELARRGVYFTQAYASSSVCSPTRAALMTGKHPVRTGITDWIPGVRYPHAPLATPRNPLQLALAENTLAERLHARGYRTLHVGKWHLGGEGFGPREQGFDVNIGGSAAGHPSSYFSPYGNEQPADGHRVRPLATDGSPEEYLPDRLTDEALALVRESKDRPFLLYFSHYSVHLPLQAPAADVARLRAKPGHERENAVYAAMVESVDRSVGRLVDGVRALGLERETLFVITSDNGGEASATDNRPLRGCKGTLYEGGIRVPLIVSGAGVTSAGSMCRVPATSVDLFATLAEAGGVRLGADEVDGRGLAPLLVDPNASLPERALVWHYPHYHTEHRAPASAIREGHWKLVYFWSGARSELYDLERDPGEQHDLAATERDVAVRLRKRLLDWLETQGAERPLPNPAYDAAQPFAGVLEPEHAPPPMCSCALVAR